MNPVSTTNRTAMNPIARSILAVLGGFATAAIAIFLTTKLTALLLLPRFVAGEPATLPTSYFAANISAGFVCAVLGGCVASKLAERLVMLHVGALALLIVFMGFLYGLVMAASDSPEALAQPTWYAFAIALVGGAGALIGGVMWQQYTQQKSEANPQDKSQR
jgi:hypothetical protein